VSGCSARKGVAWASLSRGRRGKGGGGWIVKWANVRGYDFPHPFGRLELGTQDQMQEYKVPRSSRLVELDQQKSKKINPLLYQSITTYSVQVAALKNAGRNTKAGKELGARRGSGETWTGIRPSGKGRVSSAL